MKRIIVSLMFLFGFGQVQADGLITDGGATFNWFTTSFVDHGQYTLTTEPGGELIGFQYWFAYRTDMDTSESLFPVPDAEDYSGNVATLTWNNVDGKGFRAQVTLILQDQPGNSALARARMSITNTSGANLGLEIFTVMDFDKPALGFGDDVAVLRAPDIIQVDDDGIEGGLTCEFAGFGSTAYKVTRTIVAGNIRALIFDGAIDNWDDSGLPFGPGDWIGSFQYSFPSIADGESDTLYSSFSVNVELSPTVDVAVPTLSQWSVLLMGLLFLFVAILILRRKRLRLSA